MQVRMVETTAVDVMMNISLAHYMDGHSIFTDCVDLIAEKLLPVPENRIITIECSAEEAKVIEAYLSNVMDGE